MPVPTWLSSDSVEAKTPARGSKGWAPRPNGKVKLVSGWNVPERGAGQDEETPDSPPTNYDPEIASLLSRTGGWASDAYRGSTATPDSLTSGVPDATTTPGPDTSTLAPPAPPPPGTSSAPARSVLPSSAAGPVQAPAPRTGVSNRASALPPQGPSSAGKLGGNQEAFLQQNAPLALSESQRSGIPWQVYVGIAANETGWGSSTLATKNHNYFSIKGKGPAGSVSMNAWEVVNGQNTTQQSDFRNYTDPGQSYKDFTDFLNSNPRYQPALNYLQVHPSDWRGFVHMLNDEGYATDPNWADKVISIGSQFGDDQNYMSSELGGVTSTRGGIAPVLDVGSSAIGSRYQWGGAGGRTNFDPNFVGSDCSGFVSWAYEQGTGLRLPAQTSAMYAYTNAISPQDAQPGDLVFYNMGQGEHLEHVGIYAGNGSMLHDSSINPNGGVDLTPMWGGAEFRRVPGVDPTLRGGTPSNWSGQGSQQSWVVMVHSGRQYFFSTDSSGQSVVQDLGPIQGHKDGEVIDTSANYEGGQTPTGMGGGQEADPDLTQHLGGAPAPKPAPSLSDLVQPDLGKPYKMAAGRENDMSADPGDHDAYDCSSFVASVAARQGYKLSPFTDRMYDETQAVDPGQEQAGDLIFYQYKDPEQKGVTYPHVGFYLGNGRTYEARWDKDTGGSVGEYDQLDPSKYKPVFRRMAKPGTGSGQESKRRKPAKGSALEQALQQMIEAAISERMGSGQDEGDGATTDQTSPYYRSYTDASGNEVPLPPPSSTTVNRAADLGWLGTEYTPQASGERAAKDEAQAWAPGAEGGYQIPTTAQANDFLQQQTAAQPPEPAALTATSEQANAAVGRFDLTTGAPQDPTRHAITPPPLGAKPTPTPTPNAPWIPQGLATAGQQPTVPPAAPIQRPITPLPGQQPTQTLPQGPSLIDRINSDPRTGVEIIGDTASAAGTAVRDAVDRANDDHRTGVQILQDAAAPLAGPVQAASAAAVEVAPYLSPVGAAIKLAPGIQATATYIKDNGIDAQPALDKLLHPEPGSITDTVTKKAINGQQMTPIEAAQFGLEWSGKMNDFRADLVRAAQPPEIRGTPHGEAMANALAMITDPLNVIGLPEVSLGRKALIEGAVDLAPEASRTVEFLTHMDPEAKAARMALHGPYTATDQIRALQQAGIDLNDSLLIENTQALKDIGAANRKFEPLSGEQLRRTILTAVARNNPKGTSAQWLEKADQILSKAGLGRLTSEEMLAAGPAHPTVLDAASKWATTPEEAQALVADSMRRAGAPSRTLADVARQPGAVQVDFAAKLGLGGGAGLLYQDHATDPDDPFRQQKIASGALIGALAPTLGAHLIGLLYKGFDATVLQTARKYLAPTMNMNQAARDSVRTWAGEYALGATGGQRLEAEMRAAFGNMSDHAWLGLAQYIEEHNALPRRYNGNVAAQNFLNKWRKVVSWAVHHDVVPNEINFVKPGSPAKQYVPHATAEELQRSMDRAIKVGKGDEARGGRVASSGFDYYNQPRTFDTLADGINSPGYGKTWKYDGNIPKVWGNYYATAAKRRANQNLVEDLLKQAQSNNPSLFTSAGLRNYVLKGEDIFALPPGMSRGDVDPSAVSLSFIPQFRNQDVYASEPLARVLKHLFVEPSEFDMNPVARGILDTGSLFKHNVLSGSGFHLVNELRQMAVTQGFRTPQGLWTVFKDGTLPGTWNRFLQEPQNAAMVRTAIKDGLNLNMDLDRPGMGKGVRAVTMALNTGGGFAAGYGAAAATGQSEDERIKDGLKLALVGALASTPFKVPGLGGEARSMVEHLSNAMWSRWIPAMKLTTYSMYAPEFGGRAAADFVNSVYGGQNLMAIARSRTVQDVMKFAMLAPDWQEGWARQIGNALFDWKGPQGTMNRRYWASAALQSAFWLEAGNLAFSRHWSWENDPDATMMWDMSGVYDAKGWDHRDPTTGQPYKPYLDFMGPYRGMFEVFQQIGRWATAGAMKGAGLDPSKVPGGPEVAGEFGRIPEPLPPNEVLGNYLKSRVGIVPMSMWEMGTGTNYLGQNINQPNDSTAQLAVNRVSQAFTHFLPTGESQLATSMTHGDPMPMTVLSTVSGMRTKHESATTRFFQYQDQYVRDLSTTTDYWNEYQRRNRADNLKISQNIEAMQSGTTDKDNKDWSKETHAARETAILDAAANRVTQHKSLSKLIDEASLTPEERQQYQGELAWLDAQTTVGGTDAPADIVGRPDIDKEELFRLAWNRDPTQVADLSGQSPAPDSPQAALLSEAEKAMAHRPGATDDKDLANLRARWTQETAALYGIDPATMEDMVKAHLYQYPDNEPPKLQKSDGSSITSATLDDIVSGWEDAGRSATTSAEASRAKQEYLFETAQQNGVDEQALAQRVKLRTLPMTNQTDAAVERSKALDIQMTSKLVPYMNPDGSPMGGPAEWKDMDNKLLLGKDNYRGGKFWTADPDVPDDKLNEMKAARDRATAQRTKDLLNAPQDVLDAYEKWFGEGAIMTDAQWQRYQAGTLNMWKDNPDPREAKARNGAMLAWKALTPDERVKIDTKGKPVTYVVTNQDTGQKETVTYPLGQYIRYINSKKSDRWKAVGVDPMLPPGVSSED